FNFYSHGTQDVYPTFLREQHGLDSNTTGNIAIIYNIGAILGGWTFGAWSQTAGRRRTIIIAAALSIPIAYLWSISTAVVCLPAHSVLMQVCVQCAWGVIPAHLNELSPPNVRATFPGTIYQLGNLIASSNAVLQTTIARNNHGNYAL